MKTYVFSDLNNLKKKKHLIFGKTQNIVIVVTKYFIIIIEIKHIFKIPNINICFTKFPIHCRHKY